MDLRDQLDEAIYLAAKYHKGQVDKQQVNYILHPISIMMMVDTLEEKIVAMLHDTLEDTALTSEDLRHAGFGEDIIEAVLYLTRDREVTYMDYIRKLKECELARKVKLADLKNNMRDGCPEALLERYRRAYEILSE